MGSAEEDHVNRNRLIVGSFIVVIVLVLVVSGSVVLYREWKSRQPEIGQREPLPRLGYCAPGQVRPCVISFTLNSDGKMVINIRTDDPSSLDYYIKIKHGEAENIYGCLRAGGFSSSVSCIGDTMPVGEVLQFLVISKKDDRLLAEGQFPIIGLALATPQFAATPTIIPFSDRPPK